MNTFAWVQCESRADLAAQLRQSSCRVFEEFASDQCNTFGYLKFKQDSVCLPVVFYNLGLTPQATRFGDSLFVGVSEQVAGYSFETGKQAFVYNMPTVFHEFVAIDGDKAVVLDETGFVVLSPDGKELGSRILGDVIDAWHFDNGRVTGSVLSGDSFAFVVEDLL